MTSDGYRCKHQLGASAGSTDGLLLAGAGHPAGDRRVENGASGSGAKFWMKAPTDLKNRGVSVLGILICCVDGLKEFPQAIEAVFPVKGVRPSVYQGSRSPKWILNARRAVLQLQACL